MKKINFLMVLLSVTATTIYAEPSIDAGSLETERPNSFIMEISQETLDNINNKQNDHIVNIESALAQGKKMVQEDANSIETIKKTLPLHMKRSEIDAKKSFFGRTVSFIWNAVTAAASAVSKNVLFVFGRA